MTPNIEKLILALKRYHPHMAQQGPAFVRLYPMDRIAPEVFDQITVPVPLPLAMVLFGLGLSLLGETADTPFPEIIVPPETPQQ